MLKEIAFVGVNNYASEDYDLIINNWHANLIINSLHELINYIDLGIIQNYREERVELDAMVRTESTILRGLSPSGLHGFRPGQYAREPPGGSCYTIKHTIL